MTFLSKARRLLTRFSVLLLFLCQDAFARAGGGGGFSGGGGGFSGGGGGFSGGGLSGDGELFVLIHLLFRYPAVGVPVLVIGIVAFAVLSKQGKLVHMSKTIQRAAPLVRSKRCTAVLTDIKARDAEFDADAFRSRCEGLFPKVQAAWSEQKMLPVRHYLSDGVYERFGLQLKMQAACGVRNEMHAVRVRSSEIISAESDPFFDTIHVSVKASAVDLLVATETGKRLQGADHAESFTEVWTFLRRPGATTKRGGRGLFEGYCPNCGTPLTLNTSVACESCRAIVNSGEYDWVLSEITQASVWTARRHASIAGVDAMRQVDPAFNVQAVEDRASAIFWSLRAAEFFASADYITPVALSSYVSKIAPVLAPDSSGMHRFYADAAVGCVELAEVSVGGKGGVDRARVRVHGSGHFEKNEIPSLIRPRWDLSTPFNQEFVLRRNHGVKSQQASALTSFHCPGCGAPQEASATGSCRYCGLAQNDGSVSWVLEAVDAFGGIKLAQKATQEGAAPGASLSVQSQESLVMCAIQLMMADGIIAPKEEALLERMAERRGISESRLQILIQQASAGDAGLPDVAGDYDASRELLMALVRMCLADGKICRHERKLLSGLAGHLGYADADINMMIRKVRTELYQTSRQTLKQQKAG